MKTIKELEAELEEYPHDKYPKAHCRLVGEIQARKDVLGLIDEILKVDYANYGLEELKKRING